MAHAGSPRGAAGAVLRRLRSILPIAQPGAALVFAVVLATVIGLAGGVSWDVGSLDTGAWVGAVASGILYYGLGFRSYLSGLRQVPASYAGAFLPLIPVFGVAAGFLLGERLEPRQWLGALIIVAGTAAIAVHNALQSGSQHQDGGEPAARQLSECDAYSRVSWTRWKS